MEEKKENMAGGVLPKEGSHTKEEQKTTITPAKRLSELTIMSILQRYDTYISLANQKASFFIGAASILIVALISGHKEILAASEIAQVTWLNDVIYILTGLCLFAILSFSILVALPITKAGNKFGAYTSFIAFSSVSKMESDIYISKLSSSDYDLWHDLAQQSYIVAGIVANKFKFLNIASWTALAAVLMSLILSVFVII